MSINASSRAFLKALLRRSGVYLFKNSAPRGFNVFDDLCRAGVLTQVKTFIDVGANDGEYAASAMSAMHGLKTSILIEPDNANCSKLIERFGHRAHVLRCAASNYSGPGLLKLSSSDAMHHLVSKDYFADAMGDSTVSVDVLTLSDIVREIESEPPYFIKTDTEGHDVFVIEGMRDMVDKTVAIFTEGAFDGNPHITNFQCVFDLLTKKNFLFWGFYDQSGWGNCGSCNFVNGLFVNRAFLP